MEKRIITFEDIKTIDKIELHNYNITRTVLNNIKDFYIIPYDEQGNRNCTDNIVGYDITFTSPDYSEWTDEINHLVLHGQLVNGEKYYMTLTGTVKIDKENLNLTDNYKGFKYCGNIKKKIIFLYPDVRIV